MILGVALVKLVFLEVAAAVEKHFGENTRELALPVGWQKPFLHNVPHFHTTPLGKAGVAFRAETGVLQTPTASDDCYLGRRNARQAGSDTSSSQMCPELHLTLMEQPLWGQTGLVQNWKRRNEEGG